MTVQVQDNPRTMLFPSRQSLALVLAGIVPALWAVNNLIARVAPGVIAPYTLTTQRWLLAGLLFGWLARRELWHQRHMVLADWRHMLVLGALGMWICGGWIYVAGRTTSAVNIALIYALSPALIALASRFWLKEPFSIVQGAGVLLAFTGVLNVVLKGQWLQLAQVRWAAGDIWMLGAALSWTFYSILLKHWQSPLSDRARLAPIALTGVLILLPFALWETVHAPEPVFSWPGLALALVAALVPGYAAYLGYSIMLRELGAARVSVMLYLGPPWGALLAWLVLGEPIRAYHAAGLALIVCGIYLVNRRRSPAPAPGARTDPASASPG